MGKGAYSQAYNLRSIPKTHILEGENHFLKAVF